MAEQESSYWHFTKKDFFPTNSFTSFRTYLHSVSLTFPRFCSQLFHRSSDSIEVDLQAHSVNPLRRVLTWLDLCFLGFGSVIGTGIFVLTSLEARSAAGPAIVLSYVISGASALLSVFCYAEFAVEIPSAGGSFSYLRVELGDFVAYIAAANILLEAVVGAAGVARSWTSYFATLINLDPDRLRIHIPALKEGYNLLDPIAVAVLIITSFATLFGTKLASTLNWVTTAVGIAIIAFVIGAGFTHAKAENLTPFMPFGLKGVVEAAAVVYWAYTGFDMVATLAEETKNPAKDIPLGLIGSMSSIVAVYAVMSLVLVMMQKYSDLDPNAGYSVAFAKVGMKWAKYLVALGALKGMTTGMLVGALGQARYTTQIARAHMIPPYFALVHPKTGTPVYATMVVTLTSAVIALFSSLDVLASVSSISTLFIFMLMAVALLVRRYYVKGETSRVDRTKLILLLFGIIGSSLGVSACWNSKYSGWVGYAVSGGVWFLSTLGLSVLVGERRAPKVWGVPLVPWMPSMSVVTNLFLMGSLGFPAFIRFGICTLVMLVYYVFVGLHATYDVVQQQEEDDMRVAKLEKVHGLQA